MLTRLCIKNFKSLKDTGDLDIRPLTFLVGPNSSGKSSLLQILLMLRQTIDSTDIDNPLLGNNGWVAMGAYPEFIYKGQKRRNLEVGLEFTEPIETKGKKHLSKRRKLYMKTIFSCNKSTNQIELKESEVNIGRDIQRIFRVGRSKKYSAVLEYFKKGKPKQLLFNNVKPIKFYDFRLISKHKSIQNLIKTHKPPDIFLYMGHVIETEIRDIFYLGPLRDFPKRIYVTSGQAPQDVGIRGERSADLLWVSRHREKQKELDLQKEVQYWFKRFNFANRIRLQPIGEGNYFKLLILDPAANIEVNLADIGFGASQTLPVILESLYASPDSILLIEQPEIHLHPTAQSTLADLFIDAVNRRDHGFIIETHSEHILSRVRRRIAENKIEKGKIAIYYFEPSSHGTKIREIKLTNKGQYENFPKGFFEEDIVEAFEHLKAIKNI